MSDQDRTHLTKEELDDPRIDEVLAEQVELEDRERRLHLVLDYGETGELPGIGLIAFGRLPSRLFADDD